MHILVLLLTRFRDGSERSVGRKLGARVPSLAQTAEWLSLLIDSHFSTLILTPSAHPLLGSLRAALTDHLSICRSASALKGFLTVLTQRTALVSRPETGEYHVEVFHL